MAKINEQYSVRCFEGFQKMFSHKSSELGCDMNCSIFIPPQAEKEKVPVIYFLSGLSCTEENFIQKSGVQRYAAEHGVIIVGPDTSPRNFEPAIPGIDDDWDFGIGAGFYVDATQDPYKKNFRMYSYITSELPEIINKNFPVLPDKQSIMGHSMGGHGAMICALKNPGKYKSVSVFAPICNPKESPWGQKAFNGYLGSDSSAWDEWDATCSAQKYEGKEPLEIFIDQGKEDKFLQQELLVDNLENACQGGKVKLDVKMREGYDHSYFFIATFMEEHIIYHMNFLNAK